MERKIELKKFPECGYEIRYNGRSLYHHITNKEVYDAWILKIAKQVQKEIYEVLERGELGPQ